MRFKGIVWINSQIVAVVSYLVRVHDGGGHLDGAAKVEVVVTHGVGELLNRSFCQPSFVLGNDVVDWSSSGN